MNNNLPHFILAGSPKCGSTSLYYYLAEHPDIYMSPQKEIHYFTFDILNALDQGPNDKRVNAFHIGNYEDYINQFKQAKPSQIIGEVSPSYVNYPETTIPKIKKHLGDPKIIMLIRDPIKRAYSNYLHLLREDREKLSFYDALLEEEARMKNKYSDFWYYRFNSMYYEKIKKFDEAFDRMLIITTENLNENPKAVMKSIYKFLGVDYNFDPKSINEKYNPGGLYKSNLITKFFFRQSRLRSVIKRLMPITPGMKKIKLKMIKKFKEKTPDIDPKAEEFLVKHFKKDVENLKKNFDIDLSLWNIKYTTSNE
ncbi:sulfotransferase family protein [Flavobacteriaceae bacterium 14752]|uniref:sulfotransferase family protein n=1 Tax=Mesohalobacter salilacus TaxID=2491711 RepID=UPI000F6380DC|nr:sulfotransferase [Flavobacteriaceae bacterium 14752]